MVPEAFMTFFATSAAAGATLAGLLFVAVSIAPHETVKVGAPIERRAISASAFTALINAFLISLAALIPQSNAGIVTAVMGAIGFVNTLSLARHLLKERRGWYNLLQRGALALGSLIAYGYEIYFAVLLLQTPTDTGPLYGLAGLLLAVYGLGIVRAWQVLGARRFSMLDGVLNLLHEPEEPPQAESAGRQASSGQAGADKAV